MSIIEKAPAKINLGLSIIGKRHDNYHDLEMIMVSVDLNEYITVYELESDIIIESNTSKVPLNKKMIFTRLSFLSKNNFTSKRVSMFI